MDHVSIFAVGTQGAVSKYIEEGLSGRAATLRLQLSFATGARWARQVKTLGHGEPAPRGQRTDMVVLAQVKGQFRCRDVLQNNQSGTDLETAMPDRRDAEPAVRA